MPGIDVNGTTLAYTDTGSGTPVVLAHSLFFNRTMFDPLVEYLAGRGFRTISYDHRNQGESASASRDECDMDTLADDAAALIQALDLGRVHYAGNSMGGFLALRLAARHPELVLTATAMGSSSEAEYKLAEYEPLVGVMEANGTTPVIDILLGVMFGKTSLTSRPELTDPWRETMLTLPTSIADSVHGVIFREEIRSELATCPTPVLAIAGAEDETYPQPISGANIADASGGSYVAVEAGGHSVALEQPERVGEHLVEFFASAKA